MDKTHEEVENSIDNESKLLKTLLNLKVIKNYILRIIIIVYKIDVVYKIRNSIVHLI